MQNGIDASVLPQKLGHVECVLAHLDPSVQAWLQTNLNTEVAAEILKNYYAGILESEMLEQFLHKRFPFQKRFSIEGAETFVAALQHTITAAQHTHVVLAMPHRGRVATQVTLLRRPLETLLGFFDHEYVPEEGSPPGDVKYHLGWQDKRDGRTLMLLPNPSHLEAIYPVAVGYARGLQNHEANTVLPIVVHGDHAFAAQGVVAETLNLSRLKDYTPNGVLHFVVSNGVGFTTDNEELYGNTSTIDLAQAYNLPVLRVHAHDVTACAKAVNLALRYLSVWRQDILVDIVCTRKYGHNETDDPTFTQPLLYQKLKHLPSIREYFEAQLLQDHSLTPQDAENLKNNFNKKLQNAFAIYQKEHTHAHTQHTFLTTDRRAAPTLPDQEKIVQLLQYLHTPPENFHLHPKLQKTLETRRQAYVNGIDWATAENLAFGVLLDAGVPVRLAGQDSQRGTFSQRHAVWHDTQTGKTFCPYSRFKNAQIVNSPLSEYAALGFEYGYAWGQPHGITIWEAQFGDFANNAQTIFDQFITSAQSKWGCDNNLVVLLPHGYEGQGHEHSSARIERLLQACAGNNMRVCQPSTPAQYFHLLLSQVNARTPLVILTPKSLLRNPACTSPVEAFTHGSFQTALLDTRTDTTKTVWCSGKVYYELAAANSSHVALNRLEQLYPLAEHPSGIWCQEEPQNMGAWPYLSQKCTLTYAGRPESPCPACAFPQQHKREQDTLINAALH